MKSKEKKSMKQIKVRERIREHSSGIHEEAEIKGGSRGVKKK